MSLCCYIPAVRLGSHERYNDINDITTYDNIIAYVGNVNQTIMKISVFFPYFVVFMLLCCYHYITTEGVWDNPIRFLPSNKKIK